MEVAGDTDGNYIIRSMSVFRKGLSPHQTALAMIGAKAGSQVLVLGADDPALAGEVALVTGLNGRTLVVDPDVAAEKRIETAAGQAGALIEFTRAPRTMLPLDSDTFDVVVLPGLAALSPEERVMTVGEGLRVARPGGRVVIVAREKRPGVFGVLAPKVPLIGAATATELLSSAGARAVRRLAVQEGTAYYEGRK